ncbi:MAG: AIR synthase-related protein, partial [Dehalococcoidia bacterium]
DCLNFGNPERPEVYYQMEGVIQGIADACSALGTPVISGNVSLYNETGKQAVYPTPVIGMLGLLDDVAMHVRSAFVGAGDDVFVLGASADQPPSSLAGSEYLKLLHGKIAGRISIDLQLEARVHRAALAAIRDGIVTTAHDCSDGGLAIALAEMCLAGGKGLDASGLTLRNRTDAALFGEAQSRIMLALRPDSREALAGIANGLDVPFQYLGTVTSEQRLRLGPIDVSLDEMRETYESSLERALAATTSS